MGKKVPNICTYGTESKPIGGFHRHLVLIHVTDLPFLHGSRIGRGVRMPSEEEFR